MHISEFKNSDYYSNEDFEAGPQTFTIESVDRGEFEDKATGKMKKKCVITFREADKRLALGIQKVQEIADWYGNDTDRWIGKRVECYRGKVNFGGKMVACVAVRKPSGVAEEVPL